MKHQDVMEMERTAEKIADSPKILTIRKERLLHLASLVRALPPDMPIAIYHNLENYSAQQCSEFGVFYPAWKERHVGCLFSLMANDPIMQESGFKLSGPVHTEAGQSGTLNDVMDFLQVNQEELHAFSCYCGGAIDRDDMADRIERLANK